MYFAPLAKLWTALERLGELNYDEDFTDLVEDSLSLCPWKLFVSVGSL